MLARARFLVPNALTAGNLLGGLTALLCAARGQTAWACGLILLCAGLDGLDGTAARRLHGESLFGRRFDSCADLISFGAAPAAENLRHLPWPWSAAAGIYLLCAAGRLLRFERSFRPPAAINRPPSPYSLGLPTTAGAGCYAAALLLFPAWAGRAGFQAGLLAALSLLMISRIPFPRPETLLAFLKGCGAAGRAIPARSLR